MLTVSSYASNYDLTLELCSTNIVITTIRDETTTSIATTTTVATTTTTETTTMETTTTQSAQLPVHCCCRCCYDVTSSPLTSSCTVCGDESLADAAQCAAQTPPSPTEFIRPTEPNFEPPAQLEGSQYPERLAVTPEFAAMEQLTESLAAMPVAEQAALGFTTADFILECTYDGVPCNMDTYVEMRISIAWKIALRKQLVENY